MNFARESEQVQLLHVSAPVNSSFTFAINGRPAFTYADINLSNSKILIDGTSMMWMDGHLDVETECYGGCKASCARQCSGESCCMNTLSGTGKVSVGFDLPGDMLSFGVKRGDGWVLTPSAFVASSTNIKVSTKFAGCAVCCCTDEGPFLTTVRIDDEAKEDTGVFLAGSYGMLERHDVAEGKKLYVANGNFFAGHSEKDLSVTMLGGCANLCLGAGLKAIVFQFDGPCVIYTQSRNPMDLKRLQMAGFQQDQQQQQNKNENGGGEAYVDN